MQLITCHRNHGITYDGDNRVTTETDQTLNGATTYTSVHYITVTGYQLHN